MSDYMEDTIGGVEESKEFTLTGNCDIWVSGITSGSVKLQIKFKRSDTWRDVPDEKYTNDIFKTIFISESEVRGRIVGVSVNTGVYIRLARFMNN